jgi:nucleoside-diphosphate-sugar epimerase
MRVLVIGGSGFIGAPLVRQLVEQGHETFVVQRPESRVPIADGARVLRGQHERLDELDPSPRELRPDVVVDLILSSGRQAQALVRAFRGHAGRIVAISSIDVYRAVGVTHGVEAGPLEPLPLREDSALRTKLATYSPQAMEMVRRTFQWVDDEYDKIPVEREVMSDAALPATVLRLPMVYGPGDRLHRFWPVLKRMLDRRPVLVFSEGMAQWRAPRGFVDDVAAAIALAVTEQRAAGRIYNVAESESVSELEWARLIGDALGWRGELLVVPDEMAPPGLRPPGDTRQHWVADSSRIREELGYRERGARSEAMRRTIEWERANPPAVELTPIDYAAEDAVIASRAAR